MSQGEEAFKRVEMRFLNYFFSELSRQLTTIWSNFVKNGTPRNPRNPKTSPEYRGNIHPLYRSPRTSFNTEEEVEEEEVGEDEEVEGEKEREKGDFVKKKHKRITPSLSTNLNWTNLAKKVIFYKLIKVTVHYFSKMESALMSTPFHH